MPERSTAMANGKALLLSHSLVFLAGFAAGKLIDYEELATYREAHEGFVARWRRRAGTAGLSILAAGTLVMVVRMTLKSGKKM